MIIFVQLGAFTVIHSEQKSPLSDIVKVMHEEIPCALNVYKGGNALTLSPSNDEGTRASTDWTVW